VGQRRDRFVLANHLVLEGYMADYSFGVLSVVGLGGKTSPAGASVATALLPMPANAKMGSRATGHRIA